MSDLRQYRLTNVNTGEVLEFRASPEDGDAIVDHLDADQWVVLDTRIEARFRNDEVRQAVRRALIELRHRPGEPRIESRIIIPIPEAATRDERATRDDEVETLAASFFETAGRGEG
jgi:hypothetical protein